MVALLVEFRQGRSAFRVVFVLWFFGSLLIVDGSLTWSDVHSRRKLLR